MKDIIAHGFNRVGRTIQALSGKSGECSLCGRAVNVAGKIVIGKRGSICVDCLKVCALLADSLPLPPAMNFAADKITRCDEGACRLCGRTFASPDVLFCGKQGAVCVNCVRCAADALN